MSAKWFVNDREVLAHNTEPEETWIFERKLQINRK